jgi:hypothetical protein
MIMNQTKFEWAYLAQQRIRSVYYLDEHGQAGQFHQELGLHLLSYGTILLMLDSGQTLRIENDIEGEGLTLSIQEAFYLNEYHKIQLKEDPIWCKISNLIVKKVEVYPGFYFKGNIKKDINTTVELVFLHGESLFISNAEMDENRELAESLFSFALYNKREIGLLSELIPKTV